MCYKFFTIVLVTKMTDQTLQVCQFMYMYMFYGGYIECWHCIVGKNRFCNVPLKTMDTIGKCQRPVFSLGVSQTNLWKFELDWSLELWVDYERKKHPCHTKLCVLCLISRPQILNLRSQNQTRGKLLLSWKLRHFRGNHFTQCFIPSTPSPLLVTKGGFLLTIILSNN